MTKVKVYLRIGKTPKGLYKVEGSHNPRPIPIKDTNNSYGGITKFFPTVFMGLEINLPDEAFQYAEQIIAEVDFRHKEVTVIDIPPDIKAKIRKLAIDKLKT